MKTLDQIAAELQGYDPTALPATTVGDFLAQLVELLSDTETVGIFEALDRVLAQDIVSPIDVPPHDNAAMDGFALRGACLSGDGETVLRVVGTCYAGDARWSHPHPGGRLCAHHDRGRWMPDGLDTVVPVEFVRTDWTARRSACTSPPGGPARRSPAPARRRPDGRTGRCGARANAWDRRRWV